MLVTLACASTAQVATPTSAPPTTVPTIAPTYTPYPTYTPVPTATTVPPTNTPVPTNTMAPVIPPTDAGPTLPNNCVESDVSGYITCVDDTGNIEVDVPDYWTDINGSTWAFNDQEIGVAISAAPDIAAFQDYYDAEGMFFGASDTFARIGGYVEFLDYYTDIYRGDCTLVGRFDYNDGVYRGKYDQYSNCGGTGGYDAYVLCAVDIVDPTSKIILVEIQVTPGDTYTIEQIWGTFFVYF
jgi:hypothetical protein